MSLLRAIVICQNILEIMWYRLKSIFLHLYLTWGVLLCDIGDTHHSHCTTPHYEWRCKRRIWDNIKLIWSMLTITRSGDINENDTCISNLFTNLLFFAHTLLQFQQRKLEQRNFIPKYLWEKGRDLTQSCDKSPYTPRKKAAWQHKNATKNFDYTTIVDRMKIET